MTSFRVVSSAQTFQVKFVSPLLFLVMTAFLAGMLELDLFPGISQQLFKGRLPPAGIDLFWGGWVLVGLYTAWWSCCLKRVAVDGESLYVSNYLQEVKLPLSAIVDVRENRWLKMHPVTLDVGADTPWGSNIRFMPKIRWLMPSWVSHPIVRELKDMAYWAKAERRAVNQLQPDVVKDWQPRG